MERGGSRGRATSSTVALSLVSLTVVALGPTACRSARGGANSAGPTRAPSVEGAAAHGAAARDGADEDADELDGSEILHRVCTECHDLGGLSAYADYWGEPEWRKMVDTMITYGASLGPEEYEVLVRYLGEHYRP